MADGLTTDPAAELSELLAVDSIATLIHRYDLRPGAAPSTTVNIVRTVDDHLDVLVLCDSRVIIFDTAGQIHQIRDDRLAQVSQRLRPRGGLKHLPPAELAALIESYEAMRNHYDGFWCVSATANTARQAVYRQFPAAEVHVSLAMTGPSDR